MTGDSNLLELLAQLYLEASDAGVAQGSIYESGQDAWVQ